MKRDSIKLIITIGFGCLLILMSVVAFISLSQMNDTIEDMATVVEVTNAKMHAANAMREYIRLRGEILQNMYLTDDYFERDELRLLMPFYALQFIKSYDQFRQYNMSTEERNITKKINQHVVHAEAIHQQATEVLLSNANNEKTINALQAANEARITMMSYLNELVILQEKNAKNALVNSVLYHEQTQTIVIILTAISFLIGILISILVVREASRKNTEIHYRASHDTLTSLVNRKEFEHRLEVALKNANPEQTHVLCYLDLDQFKNINDTCGHHAGDELLKQLARVISSKVRDRDTLGRLGGDEFGLLLENCSLDKAIEITEGIVSLVKSYEFKWGDRSLHVGVSIGLVQISQSTQSAAVAMSQADVACYAAKDMGRNRVHVYEFEDSQLNHRHQELSWVANINDSIQKNRFCLYAQPIINIANPMATPMYEALLRVKDNDGNIISPGKYIPAAERFNLMREVDEWVLANLLCKISDNQDMPCLFFNLSTNSIVDREFCTFAENELKRHNIKPDRLCFEITETSAIKNIQQVTRFISTLKEYNCQFALDNFGRGISSFGYLKNLPIDFLKIDGDIVSSMAKGNAEHAMVAAINQIGKVMGIKTIAEHVESESTLTQLRAMEVDYAQGYKISRPFPVEELDLQAIIQNSGYKAV